MSRGDEIVPFMTPQEFSLHVGNIAKMPKPDARVIAGLHLMALCLARNSFGKGMEELALAMGIDLSDLPGGAG